MNTEVELKKKKYQLRKANKRLNDIEEEIYFHESGLRSIEDEMEILKVDIIKLKNKLESEKIKKLTKKA